VWTTAPAPEELLPTIHTLNDAECRIYSTPVPHEIREPVLILEGGGHKILAQLAKTGDRYELTFLDDFDHVVISD
jgi:hypothetical protein